MAWYEFVIFFSLAFVGVVIVVGFRTIHLFPDRLSSIICTFQVYFGNRFYTGRKRTTPDVELDTGQQQRHTENRRRRPTNNTTTTNTTRRNADPSEEPEIIFTLANARIGQTTLILNPEKLTDAQRVGNDPPPSYDDAVVRGVVRGARNN